MARRRETEARTTVTFLGTSAVIPRCDSGYDEDTASFVVNGRVLVDVGWNATLRMPRHGIDPASITHLILTHCHHDHYLSLPALLFYRMMLRSWRRELKPLTILGPRGDVERVVRLAEDFLQAQRFSLDARAEPVGLAPGEPFEGPGFRLETVQSIHPVDGLCYRFLDRASGAAFCFTGDTAFNPAVAGLARGSAALIHETSLGPVAADPAANAALHSGAVDAARIALMAGVQHLYLLHGLRTQSDESVAAAQAVFPATSWPLEGETVTIPSARSGTASTAGG